MRFPTRPGLLFVLALGLTVTAGGCDLLKPQISQSKLEAALTNWLEDHDLEAKEIHCPGDQPLELDHTFECTCSIHGADIPVLVTVTDVEKGTVEWKPKYLTLNKKDAEAEILAKPQFASHELEIDCHDPVLMSIPNSDWTCDIVDKSDGKKFLATITFTDGEGTHNLKIDPA